MMILSRHWSYKALLEQVYACNASDLTQHFRIQHSVQKCASRGSWTASSVDNSCCFGRSPSPKTASGRRNEVQPVTPQIGKFFLASLPGLLHAQADGRWRPSLGGERSLSRPTIFTTRNIIMVCGGSGSGGGWA